MRSVRIGYVSLLALSLLAGKLTGRRECFLLFFFLLAVLAYALAMAVWTLAGFSYIQELSEGTSVKGQQRMLNIGIYNDKPFPFTMMRIAVETAVEGERYLLRFSLPSKDSVDFSIPIQCPYRGVYNVGMTAIEINGMFGLVRIGYDMRHLPYYRQRQIKIYPRVLELSYLPSRSQDARTAGGGVFRVAREGSAFADVRQYRQGDPAKRIHWKQSMRKRELYVKEYEVPAESGAVILLDTAGVQPETKNAVRLADLICECAAAIAVHNLDCGYSVVLRDARPGAKGMGAQVPGDYNRLREWLALLAFDGNGDAAACLELEDMGELGAAYVITPHPSGRLREVLERLQAAGNGVCCLHIVGDSAAEGAGMGAVPCKRISFTDDVAQVLGETL